MSKNSFFNYFFHALYLFNAMGFCSNVLSNNVENYIVVNKKNVIHKFVPFDERTDNFIKYVFPNWENETFDVFDLVKDSQGIAIDLGAWIGTTAIWLAKNFYHVVAVEPDRVSLICLKQNLEASECQNTSICKRPIAHTNQNVIFGPLFSALNESTSAILKEHSYTIETITLKQILDDYVYTNDAIKNHKIAFIKCDIEGGEEDIIEDLLHFAYNNKTKVYLSFHLSWWKSKKITDFENLFKSFKTNCPEPNVSLYIRQNPFTSILFEPRNDDEIYN